jgi:hypothetical protein
MSTRAQSAKSMFSCANNSFEKPRKTRGFLVWKKHEKNIKKALALKTRF